MAVDISQGNMEDCIIINLTTDVCFDHRLFTPASTPKVVDFCMHGRFYSRLKGSRAPSSGRFDMHAEDLSV